MTNLAGRSPAHGVKAGEICPRDDRCKDFLSDICALNPPRDFTEETEDVHRPRLVFGNSPRPEVKEVIRTDFRDGRAVARLHIVRMDLEPWNGIHFGRC